MSDDNEAPFLSDEEIDAQVAEAQNLTVGSQDDEELGEEQA